MPSHSQKKTKTVKSAAASIATEKQNAARVNVYRVAEQAGVSPGTVSRVLNNRGRVLAETAQRVLDAARALGFRPQVQVRTKQVAVISENIDRTLSNWGYYQTVWAHTAFALNKRGMTMIVPDSLDELRQRHVDGIIVIGAHPQARALLAELKPHLPIVITDDTSEAVSGHWIVLSDQYQAGQLAAEQFIQAGRKRLALVGSWGTQETSVLAGYKAAITAAGLKCHDALFVKRSAEVNFYNAVSRAVRLGADALFIPGANYESMEGLNVLTNVLGLKIPGDLALIGGELHGVSAFLSPPMTTIDDPLSAVANRAVDILAAVMDGKKISKRQTIPVRLISRESA